MKNRLNALISLLLLAALALTACGGGSGIEPTEADLSSTAAEPTTTTAVPAIVEPDVAEPVATEGPARPTERPETTPPVPKPSTEEIAPEPVQDALITVANGPLMVWDAPHGTVLAELPATTQFGSPTTLSVLELGDEWVQVGGIPIRPNGSVGYIARADADLRRVSFRIEVDLEARMLFVYSDDELHLESPVAVGAPENPTPSGHLFVVTDVLDTGDPDSPYGRFALGLSGMSDQLTEFAGGPGQIGIHGTNDPASIGQAVSHGCVRVPEEVAAQLAATLPLGTPVIIR